MENKIADHDIKNMLVRQKFFDLLEEGKFNDHDKHIVELIVDGDDSERLDYFKHILYISNNYLDTNLSDEECIEFVFQNVKNIYSFYEEHYSRDFFAKLSKDEIHNVAAIISALSISDEVAEYLFASFEVAMEQTDIADIFKYCYTLKKDVPDHKYKDMCELSIVMWLDYVITEMMKNIS